jgi:hypothetical protein
MIYSNKEDSNPTARILPSTVCSISETTNSIKQ